MSNWRNDKGRMIEINEKVWMRKESFYRAKEKTDENYRYDKIYRCQ